MRTAWRARSPARARSRRAPCAACATLRPSRGGGESGGRGRATARCRAVQGRSRTRPDLRITVCIWCTASSALAPGAPAASTAACSAVVNGAAAGAACVRLQMSSSASDCTSLRSEPDGPRPLCGRKVEIVDISAVAAGAPEELDPAAPSSSGTARRLPARLSLSASSARTRPRSPSSISAAVASSAASGACAPCRSTPAARNWPMASRSDGITCSPSGCKRPARRAAASASHAKCSMSAHTSRVPPASGASRHRHAHACPAKA